MRLTSPAQMLPSKSTPRNSIPGSPEFETHLTDLFGNEEWQEAPELEGRDARTALQALYERQLRDAGAEQVVRCHLHKGDRRVYSILFDTGHHKGSDRMKAAIWKVAPFGDFTFRGRDQLTLGVEPDYRPLREGLVQRFGHRGCVSIENVLNFVASDATDSTPGRLRDQSSSPWKQAGLIEVDPSARKRQWTYPNGCRLRFMAPAGTGACRRRPSTGGRSQKRNDSCHA